MCMLAPMQVRARIYGRSQLKLSQLNLLPGARKKAEAGRHVKGQMTAYVLLGSLTTLFDIQN